MADAPESGYRVLARKYRPMTLDDLVGQEPVVRTLKNAITADRVAPAFLLTGIRGTGKTTTARILAMALNCVGRDGTGGPTPAPCGVCEHCAAIAAGRHVEVAEIDAASHTQVDKMRELLDGVAYRPADTRYKVYVFDEVHMLSQSAFNALLKTLEEPPAHVKFILATTEVRKVPVTVMSRCQRFDLRRIAPETAADHLRGIAAAEGVEIDGSAVGLITRASEGSLRDALSLLDQAISVADRAVTGEAVRGMLGLADRGRVLELFDRIMAGDAAGALDELSAQYADGADPSAVLRDLAETAHWLSVIKVTPEATETATVGPEEAARGHTMAERLAMRVLARSWQMLLAALAEVDQAPNAMMAAEMAVIRLTHVAELPTPEELVRGLRPESADRDAAPAAPAAPPPAPARPLTAEPDPGPQAAEGGAAPAQAPSRGPEAALAPYGQFDDVVELIRARRDMKLLIEVETTLRLVAYSPGRIEFQPTADAAPDLAARLGGRLQTWTGARWAISVVGEGGAATIAEARAADRDALAEAAGRHPLVRAVFRAFPGARITEVRTPRAAASAAAAEALPEAADDDWSPTDDEGA